MKTVLVTAIGSFAADIVIKRLKEHGMRVVGCDIYPGEWVADARNVDAFYQVPYVTDKERYVKTMVSICKKERADALIVLLDVEIDVWNHYREALAEQGVLLSISQPEAISLCRDKLKMFLYMEERMPGLLIPTRPLSECSPRKLAYPVVCKPCNGRSSQGLHRISSWEQMEAFLSYTDVKDYIVQPQLEGLVVTADVVRDKRGKECAVICRRELLRTLNGAGTSVEVFRDTGLEAICRQAADVLDITGCVNFEFIENQNGEYHMLECNPRFAGGVEFSVMAGYDCVMNHLRCFTGEDIEASVNITGMYIARKYEEYITKITEGTRT